MRNATTWSVLLAVAALVGGVPAPAQPRCDPQLTPRSSDPLRYMLRDNRCEGRYLAEVSSSTVTVVSLTSAFEDFDPVATPELVVSWTPAAPGAVLVRAVALKPREYYRMDGVRADGSTFRWPTGVLASLRLARRDLGVVAWTPLAVGDERRDVFLPARVAARAVPTPGRSYRVVLWPGRELTEVYLSLAAVGADGRVREWLFEGRALKHGFYPAERGIATELPVSDFKRAGVYYLEVGAAPRQGPPITSQIWLFHAGE